MAETIYVWRDQNCCSLAHIGGFGGPTAHGYSRAHGYYSKIIPAKTLKDFIEQLSKSIPNYDYKQETCNEFRNLGLVSAHAISKQEHGLRILREFGGWTEVASGPMGKFDHQLISFTMPVTEFIARFNVAAVQLGVKYQILQPDFGSKFEDEDDDD